MKGMVIGQKVQGQKVHRHKVCFEKSCSKSLDLVLSLDNKSEQICIVRQKLWKYNILYYIFICNYINKI